MPYGKIAVTFVSILCSARAAPQPGISGPYAHEGLSVFLIHRAAPAWTQGAIRASSVHYLTLEQAMIQKKVVVHETNQVNELAVENVSADAVFIQGGDIVKGGNQDRMISNDFILAPHSGQLPLSAFCVERGRWGRRGSESAQVFGVSTELAAVRFDPKSLWGQASVWQFVRGLQEALASHLRKKPGVAGLASVTALASPTSLLLTQTSPPVQETVDAYTKPLAGAIQGTTDVVGYAFAVDGELRSADLYASPALFYSMWPKLLKSSAVETVRLGRRPKASRVDGSEVMAFLRGTNGVPETTIGVGDRTKLVKRDTTSQLHLESRDGSTWVHWSVVKK